MTALGLHNQQRKRQQEASAHQHSGPSAQLSQRPSTVARVGVLYSRSRFVLFNYRLKMIDLSKRRRRNDQQKPINPLDRLTRRAAGTAPGIRKPRAAQGGPDRKAFYPGHFAGHCVTMLSLPSSLVCLISWQSHQSRFCSYDE